MVFIVNNTDNLNLDFDFVPLSLLKIHFAFSSIVLEKACGT